jgi:hypothetical protein
MIHINGIEEPITVLYNGTEINTLKFNGDVVWQRKVPMVEVTPRYIFLMESNNNTADIELISNTDWRLD